LDCAKNIIKYIDFKDKYDKKINLHVIEQLVSNSYDKLLFELIRVYPSNPLYFSKLTQINLSNSVYSYCVKTNKVSQIFQIINGFKVDEIKKYLFNNNKSEAFFYNLTCIQDDFYWACYHSNIRLINFYLDNKLGKYDYTDELGFTPLMYLAINKLEDLAIRLLNTGLGSSTKLNNFNKSALHFSIENNLPTLANILYNELSNIVKNKK
jgi:hypothetical protein